MVVKVPLVYATLACTLAVIGEALLMGRQGGHYLRSLKQPAIAPPTWAWGAIGLGYYAICFVVMYRLTSQAAPEWLGVLLLVTVMTANTFWNYWYFRRKDLRVVFWYSIGYAVLAIALFSVLVRFDALAAIAWGTYVAYLPYAVLVFYRTWRINSVPASPRHLRDLS